MKVDENGQENESIAENGWKTERDQKYGKKHVLDSEFNHVVRRMIGHECASIQKNKMSCWVEPDRS